MLHRPIYIHLTTEQVDIARTTGTMAAVNGHSHVHAPPQRQQNLIKDNITGQLGAVAGSLWLRGNLNDYCAARIYASTYPSSSHPTPIRGSQICFKTTEIDTSQALWQYRLPVRPAELREGWTYVLALVPPKHPLVLLMGWATFDMFPSTPAVGGPCAGAFTLQVPQLHPCPPFMWRDGGAAYADDSLIADIENSANVAPQDQWAVVQTQWTAAAITATSGTQKVAP